MAERKKAEKKASMAARQLEVCGRGKECAEYGHPPPCPLGSHSRKRILEAAEAAKAARLEAAEAARSKKAARTKARQIANFQLPKITKNQILKITTF